MIIITVDYRFNVCRSVAFGASYREHIMYAHCTFSFREKFMCRNKEKKLKSRNFTNDLTVGSVDISYHTFV